MMTDTMDLNNSRETFRSRLDSWIFRLSNAASLPSDTDEKRLRKAVLILLAGICTTLGLLWGVGYLILGRPLAGSFPLGYSVISTFSLLYFFRSKGYKLFCRGQLALILILPVLLQLSLGGFAASGAVIIWSILSPIGALMFAGTKRAIPWFSAYVLLMVISGALDLGSTSSQPPLPAFIMVISFVLNIGGVTAIVFFLLKYFVYAREQAMAALAREHQRVRQSLSLAMEVQQNLLPQDNPQAAGLDIAGSSIYCDETGGDYFDYLQAGEAEGKIGVVVGDVSDHGIPSALLMATVRARLRQRYSQTGGIERVVSDVNRQLTEDVQDSGRFMTLFMAEIDRRDGHLLWLNAGHEPAVIYDPDTDDIDLLDGGGSLPLGVVDDIAYQVNSRDIKSGQIIAVATDGIFEAQNPQGEMFGRKRFYDIIARCASGTAAKIMEAVLEAVKNFRQGLPPKDDLTLVVIKILPSN